MRRRLALRRRRCSRRERPRRRAGGFSCTGEMIIESRFEVAGCPGFADTAHGVVGLRRPRLGRLEEDAVCAESGTTRGTPRSRPVRRGRRAARTTARGTRWSRSSPAARSWPHAPSPAPVGCRPGSRWAVGPADPQGRAAHRDERLPHVLAHAEHVRGFPFRAPAPGHRVPSPTTFRQAPHPDPYPPSATPCRWRGGAGRSGDCRGGGWGGLPVLPRRSRPPPPRPAGSTRSHRLDRRLVAPTTELPLERCRLSRPGSIVHAGRASPGKPWHG